MSATPIPSPIDPDRPAQVTRLTWHDHDETAPDYPPCASPVIGVLLREWRERLTRDDWDSLILPLIPRLVGTRGSETLETRRATMAADWLVRVHTPAWLRLAGLTAQADALSSLPEIVDFANTPALHGPLETARADAAAARVAAWRAAGTPGAPGAPGAAAWLAAWAAVSAHAAPPVWAAAGCGTWDAARDAAWSDADDAARDAAGAAAWAARDAAKARLSPTRIALQQSALALVERMIDAREAA